MSNKAKKKTSKMSEDKKRLIIVIALIASILAVTMVILALTGAFSTKDNSDGDGTSNSQNGASNNNPFDDLDGGGVTLPPIDVEADGYEPSN